MSNYLLPAQLDLPASPPTALDPPTMNCLCRQVIYLFQVCNRQAHSVVPINNTLAGEAFLAALETGMKLLGTQSKAMNIRCLSLTVNKWADNSSPEPSPATSSAPYTCEDPQFFDPSSSLLPGPKGTTAPALADTPNLPFYNLSTHSLFSRPPPSRLAGSTTVSGGLFGFPASDLTGLTPAASGASVPAAAPGSTPGGLFGRPVPGLPGSTSAAAGPFGAAAPSSTTRGLFGNPASGLPGSTLAAAVPFGAAASSSTARGLFGNPASGLPASTSAAAGVSGAATAAGDVPSAAQTTGTPGGLTPLMKVAVESITKRVAQVARNDLHLFIGNLRNELHDAEDKLTLQLEELSQRLDRIESQDKHSTINPE
ncbi:hypothetical protein MJO28_010939 [Puccinia striiformis f. sp. tritici]|uniref:Uncharacterized protein n=4 Tax=Puccinia striiformis TaxID=27350 RepID=A0A0L0V6S7_9BASI|nr:hypothetical protein Pst134EA_019750 [Puccinia striiformis f. sp. tritici]KNE95000.1 hypothetical protein PSTG_11697 [Puccinia striiformis f. sp. tritici PST-78]POW11007.1 hypothetical protein PSHT_08615 [Puccinia striiformis]KAH9449858.1 hypothetical protein Pst134EB_020667 [Puccinia striiformis f. sp. tritici]KAH9459610.1 hypothetical protein Pst134EA_019750 [Puccinia striiformis f. sp. tritici]KAI7945244.1 hypothetical protein MJO28_010939 [Puccinia striiformis f. sp. tritici]